jgi:hypothetical protein
MVRLRIGHGGGTRCCPSPMRLVAQLFVMSMITTAPRFFVAGDVPTATCPAAHALLPMMEMPDVHIGYPNTSNPQRDLAGFGHEARFNSVFSASATSLDPFGNPLDAAFVGGRPDCIRSNPGAGGCFTTISKVIPSTGQVIPQPFNISTASDLTAMVSAPEIEALIVAVDQQIVHLSISSPGKRPTVLLVTGLTIRFMDILPDGSELTYTYDVATPGSDRLRRVLLQTRTLVVLGHLDYCCDSPQGTDGSRTSGGLLSPAGIAYDEVNWPTGPVVYFSDERRIRRFDRYQSQLTTIVGSLGGPSKVDGIGSAGRIETLVQHIALHKVLQVLVFVDGNTVRLLDLPTQSLKTISTVDGSMVDAPVFFGAAACSQGARSFTGLVHSGDLYLVDRSALVIRRLELQPLERRISRQRRTPLPIATHVNLGEGYHDATAVDFPIQFSESTPTNGRPGTTVSGFPPGVFYFASFTDDAPATLWYDHDWTKKATNASQSSALTAPRSPSASSVTKVTDLMSSGPTAVYSAVALPPYVINSTLSFSVPWILAATSRDFVSIAIEFKEQRVSPAPWRIFASSVTTYIVTQMCVSLDTASILMIVKDSRKVYRLTLNQTETSMPPTVYYATVRFSELTGIACLDGGTTVVADTTTHEIFRVQPPAPAAGKLSASVSSLVGAAGSAGIIDGVGKSARISTPTNLALRRFRKRIAGDGDWRDNIGDGQAYFLDCAYSCLRRLDLRTLALVTIWGHPTESTGFRSPSPGFRRTRLLPSETPSTLAYIASIDAVLVVSRFGNTTAIPCKFDTIVKAAVPNPSGSDRITRVVEESGKVVVLYPKLQLPFIEAENYCAATNFNGQPGLLPMFLDDVSLRVVVSNMLAAVANGSHDEVSPKAWVRASARDLSAPPRYRLHTFGTRMNNFGSGSTACANSAECDFGAGQPVGFSGGTAYEHRGLVITSTGQWESSPWEAPQLVLCVHDLPFVVATPVSVMSPLHEPRSRADGTAACETAMVNLSALLDPWPILARPRSAGLRAYGQKSSMRYYAWRAAGGLASALAVEEDRAVQLLHRRNDGSMMHLSGMYATDETRNMWIWRMNDGNSSDLQQALYLGPFGSQCASPYVCRWDVARPEQSTMPRGMASTEAGTWVDGSFTLPQACEYRTAYSGSVGYKYFVTLLHTPGATASSHASVCSGWLGGWAPSVPVTRQEAAQIRAVSRFLDGAGVSISQVRIGVSRASPTAPWRASRTGRVLHSMTGDCLQPHCEPVVNGTSGSPALDALMDVREPRWLADSEMVVPFSCETVIAPNVTLEGKTLIFTKPNAATQIAAVELCANVSSRVALPESLDQAEAAIGLSLAHTASGNAGVWTNLCAAAGDDALRVVRCDSGIPLIEWIHNGSTTSENCECRGYLCPFSASLFASIAKIRASGNNSTIPLCLTGAGEIAVPEEGVSYQVLCERPVEYLPPVADVSPTAITEVRRENVSAVVGQLLSAFAVIPNRSYQTVSEITGTTAALQGAPLCLPPESQGGPHTLLLADSGRGSLVSIDLGSRGETSESLVMSEPSYDPVAVAVLPRGAILFVSPTRAAVMQYNPISTIPSQNFVVVVGFDSKPGHSAGHLLDPYAIAWDEATQAVYIAERSGCGVQRATGFVSAAGAVIRTGVDRLAGRLASSSVPDSDHCGFADAYGQDALFGWLYDVVVASVGRLLVPDPMNFRIRMIHPGGQVTTYACSGYRGNRDGPLLSADCNAPWRVARVPSASFRGASGNDTAEYAKLPHHTRRAVSGADVPWLPQVDFIFVDRYDPVIRIIRRGFVYTIAGQTVGGDGVAAPSNADRYAVDGLGHISRFVMPLATVFCGGRTYIVDALRIDGTGVTVRPLNVLTTALAMDYEPDESSEAPEGTTPEPGTPVPLPSEGTSTPTLLPSPPPPTSQAPNVTFTPTASRVLDRTASVTRAIISPANSDEITSTPSITLLVRGPPLPSMDPFVHDVLEGAADVLRNLGLSPSDARAVVATVYGSSVVAAAFSPTTANKGAVVSQIMTSAECRVFAGDPATTGGTGSSSGNDGTGSNRSSVEAAEEGQVPAPDFMSLVPGLPFVQSDRVSVRPATSFIGATVNALLTTAACSLVVGALVLVLARATVSSDSSSGVVTSCLLALQSLSLSYYAPNVVSAAVAVVLHGQLILAQAAAAISAIVCLVAFSATFVFCLPSAPTHGPFRRRLHEVLFSYVEGSRDPTKVLVRMFFFEDVAVAMLFALLGGIKPRSIDGCTIVSGGMIAVGVVHLAYLVLLRPYGSRLEQILAVSGGGGLLTLGVIAIAAMKQPSLVTTLGVVQLLIDAFFFVQVGILGVMGVRRFCRRGFRTNVHNPQGAGADDKADVPLLTEVPTCPALVGGGSAPSSADATSSPVLAGVVVTSNPLARLNRGD